MNNTTFSILVFVLGLIIGIIIIIIILVLLVIALETKLKITERKKVIKKTLYIQLISFFIINPTLIKCNYFII